MAAFIIDIAVEAGAHVIVMEHLDLISGPPLDCQGVKAIFSPHAVERLAKPARNGM